MNEIKMLGLGLFVVCVLIGSFVLILSAFKPALFIPGIIMVIIGDFIGALFYEKSK